MPDVTSPPLSRRDYWAAGLVGLAAAFLLGGYELVRSPSNSLFKEAYGKDALPYVMAATPLAVVAVLYLYGRLLTRLGPRRTLLVTTIGSCLSLVAIYAGIHAGWNFSRAILYVVREAYVVLLIEQYWSFVNSTLATGSAKRLNGPICGIASVGAIAGGVLVAGISTTIGSAALLVLAAVITLPAAGLMEFAYRRCGEPRESGAAKPSDTLGLRLFANNTMLAILLAVILLTQAVSALLDLNFQGVLQDAIPNVDEQTAFSGEFFAWLNVASFAMQFAVTPLLLRLVPLGLIHLAIPLVHVGACIYLLRTPSLFAAGLAYILFKAIDYSTFRAAKEILYIPLSFDARYRAKEVIDVFGYRFGKGGASLAITGLRTAGIAISEAGLAIGAVAAAGIWAALAIPLARAYAEVRARPQSPSEPARLPPMAVGHTGEAPPSP
jgi:AAA family ATP:ADP antiporter